MLMPLLLFDTPRGGGGGGSGRALCLLSSLCLGERESNCFFATLVADNDEGLQGTIGLT